jgi:hypothetical protein
MTSKAKLSKYNPAKAMKVHQLRVAGLSWREIHEQVGIAVSTACAWDKIVVANPELLRKAESEKHPGGNGKSNVDREALQNIQDTVQEENKYLRWWNQGERQGWVDRLLREVQ